MSKKEKDSSEEFYSRLYKREAEQILENARQADSFYAFSLAEPLYKEALNLMKKAKADISELEAEIIEFYRRYGKYKTALSKVRQVMKRKVKNPNILTQCICTYSLAGLHKEAVDCFKEKIATYSIDECNKIDFIPALQSLYEIGTVEEIIELADEMDSLFKGIPLTSIIRAKIYWHKYNDLHKAINILESYMDDYGLNQLMLSLAGEIFLSFDWKEQALKYFLKAIEVNNGLIAETEKAADLLIHFKQIKRAEKILKKFMELSYEAHQPLCCGPLYSLAGIYIHKGKIDEARDLLYDVFKYGDSTAQDKLIQLGDFIKNKSEKLNGNKDQYKYIFIAGLSYQTAFLQTIDQKDQSLAEDLVRKSIECYTSIGSIGRAKELIFLFAESFDNVDFVKEQDKLISEAKKDKSDHQRK